MTAPTVSAIVIFLNEEEFIGEAIASVLAQTTDDWELLLIDDGSTDASASIARTYCEAHPDRMRCLTHPGRSNLGMSASRQLGLRHARGTYVAYLDGDDVWRPEKLAEQVALAQRHPTAAMVYGPLEIWHSWRDEPGVPADHLYGVDRRGRQPFPDMLVPAPQVLRCFLEDEDFLPGGGLFQRSVLEDVAAPEKGFREGYEDAVVLTKVCLHHPVYSARTSWYRYRQHPAAQTKRAIAAGTNDQDRRVFLEWVGEYFDALRVTDSQLRRAHSRATWRYRHPILHRAVDGYEALANPYWWLARGDVVARRVLPDRWRRQLSAWRRRRLP